MTKITLHGDPIATNGSLPEIGATAPGFTLVDGGLNDITLDSFDDKKKLISIIPSVDTPVCALSTRRFSESAKEYSKTAFLIVSADLPFAQSRFCESLKTDSITLLSTMRSSNFGEDYGVRIISGALAGLCARAILVLDENNEVRYAQLVKEIGDEPDYEAAFAALKAI